MLIPRTRGNHRVAQQTGCSQDLLGIILVPTNDAGSTVGLAPTKGGQGIS